MRIVKSLVAMGAVAATATALAVAPALADPVNSHYRAISPQPYDVVGVGSATTENIVNALSVAYNKTVKHHNPSHPFILSWDATPPHNPNFLTQQIHLKAGCAKVLRPDGSSNGIKAIGTEGSVKYKGKTYPCVNFARSSRPRSTSDPINGPTGVSFVILAKDSVTYATTAGSNVPNNLTTAQLSLIFGCDIPAANGDPANSWGALLGNSTTDPARNTALVAPVLPQAGSGTLAFWPATWVSPRPSRPAARRQLCPRRRTPRRTRVSTTSSGSAMSPAVRRTRTSSTRSPSAPTSRRSSTRRSPATRLARARTTSVSTSAACCTSMSSTAPSRL